MAVYYITNMRSIKIGVAKDVNSRLKELQTGSDTNLLLLAVEHADSNKQDYELEKLRHRQFSTCRIRDNGEWFGLNDSLLEHINGISEYYVQRVSDEKLMVLNKMKK